MVGCAVRVGLAVVAPVALLVLAGCSDDGEGPDDRAAVYTSVLRNIVPLPAPPVEERTYVFVEPLADEVAIPLEVQAEVVSELEDVAEVRFIDDRDEAIEHDGERVREGGVLVGLGAIVESGPERLIAVRRYVDAADDDAFALTLEERNGVWEVVDRLPAG